MKNETQAATNDRGGRAACTFKRPTTLPPRPNNKHVREERRCDSRLTSVVKSQPPVPPAVRSPAKCVGAAADSSLPPLDGCFITPRGLKIHDLAGLRFAYVSIWLLLTGRDAQCARGMRPSSASLCHRDTPTQRIHPSCLVFGRLSVRNLFWYVMEIFIVAVIN